MTPETIARLDDDLARDEGFRDRVYIDTVGVPTIGRGINLNEPVDHDILQTMYERRRNRVLDQCASIKGFSLLSEPRQAVLANMLYNLGWPRLHEFQKMFVALSLDDFDRAAAEMLDSKWARQVGDRARRLATQMRTNEWQEV